ncbi:hypothetical protein GCM10023215_07780 [Pseudonocardia yuanmonensis]|uniref:Uncharacterized protein n=1 Tax=Pseudonocardia yuanmonensis TaxID=1095914 RepID=A0ABP8W215_9PSEU
MGADPFRKKAGVRALADTADGRRSCCACSAAPLPTRHRNRPYRRSSRNQKDANAAHARQRGPGERVNAS